MGKGRARPAASRLVPPVEGAVPGPWSGSPSRPRLLSWETKELGKQKDPPGATAQPQRPEEGGWGRARPGRSPRPALRAPLRPSGCSLPSTAIERRRSEEESEEKKRAGPPAAPSPQRQGRGASAADRGVWAGGSSEERIGMKGAEVSANPSANSPASAAAPGQCVRLSVLSVSRSEPPAPLGRSPPRHTRWRRSAATSVPARARHHGKPRRAAGGGASWAGGGATAGNLTAGNLTAGPVGGRSHVS